MGIAVQLSDVHLQKNYNSNCIFSFMVKLLVGYQTITALAAWFRFNYEPAIRAVTACNLS